jgi:hypothetical protein
MALIVLEFEVVVRSKVVDTILSLIVNTSDLGPPTPLFMRYSKTIVVPAPNTTAMRSNREGPTRAAHHCSVFAHVTF